MTDEVEDVLRSSRPEPREEFVQALEHRLLRPRRRRSPVLIQGFAVATTLALAIVVLGVAGALPLRLAGDRPATATQRCTTVLVDRAQRRPVFVVTRGGEIEVRYRTQIVRRPVKRCH